MSVEEIILSARIVFLCDHALNEARKLGTRQFTRAHVFTMLAAMRGAGEVENGPTLAAAMGMAFERLQSDIASTC